ncbi:MAG TPA: multiheme c-type cytochrome [Planctomycetota bacterium]|jgi:hypothetical protein|nr:multiheme c-type cytochrome [Planctomycetota bacterium]
MGLNRRTLGPLLGCVAAASLLAAALPARQGGGGIFLPGTQPNAVQITPPFVCNICHGAYAGGTVEPYDTWEGTMHANAARDPVFRAALAIANQDVAGSGEWCLRCHSPRGWLEGRSTPSDGSALTSDDLESVQCDTCHRMVDPLTAEGQGMVNPDVSWFGNGMYVVDAGNPPAEPPKRGPYTNSVSPFHGTIFSPFHRSGNLCGTCHDVANPLQANPTDPYNPQLAHAIERTYSEWKASDYYALGEPGNCQSCHMKHLVTDYACALTGFASPRPFLPTHDFTGGNTWVPQIIPGLWSLNPYAFNVVSARATQTLESASRLWVTTRLLPSGQVEATVRVKNLTGHKLPTGYPEGRRMWIQLRGLDGMGALVFESGAYDATTAILVPDAQQKVYEGLQGQNGPSGCQPSFHFILTDCIAKDNRVPPKGFTNSNFALFEGGPVGATYRDGQFWDDSVYLLPGSVATVEANLWYQTSSKEYVEFLQLTNTTDNWGIDLYNAWLASGMSPPVLMEAHASGVGPFVESGAGTPGSGGFVPHLAGGGTAAPGGTVVLALADGVGGGAGILAFGLSLLNLPLPCGTLYPFPAILISFPLQGILGVPGGGAGELELAVPNDPALSGLVSYLQVGVIDPGTPAGCTLSNGLVVTLQ